MVSYYSNRPKEQQGLGDGPELQILGHPVEPEAEGQTNGMRCMGHEPDANEALFATPANLSSSSSDDNDDDDIVEDEVDSDPDPILGRFPKIQ
jgi:hypothetical protein